MTMLWTLHNGCQKARLVENFKLLKQPSSAVWTQVSIVQVYRVIAWSARWNIMEIFNMVVRPAAIAIAFARYF
ncbi:putative phosphoenolpyruvate synthase-like protein [Anopheles sinensis]|uniref:Putative phosphoenolpyruvate synthase-like protein n=1 Tax=Anopheles sinensis TaxID=74873 RepID=A0A084WE59_ANOSI|nr:putative phosphoenolpyruvate synthase-like protein [Anopheles sinensis]